MDNVIDQKNQISVNPSKTLSICKIFPANIDSFPDVLAFCEDTLSSWEIEMKIITQMNIVVEEIFTNVAKFAYPSNTGDCEIRIAKTESHLSFTFISVNRGAW
mgnify:CR=1 FL=1